MRAQTLFSLTTFLIACLSIIGLIFIFASSSVCACELALPAYHYLLKQLTGLGLGIMVAVICASISTDTIRRWSPLFFMVCLLLVAATLIPFLSSAIHGSRRWLNLGIVSFQPSEFLKMSLIVYCSYILSKRQAVVRSLHFFLIYSALIAVPVVLLLLQPDFGQALTLSITAGILYFAAGGNINYLFTSIVASVPIVSVLIYIKSYRLKRILTFINPWKDPEGSGFQIIQSLVAIGSGNFTGMGLGQSKQKFFYLPMIQTDFIFSLIAEETGFIGSCALVMLYFLCIMGGFKLAFLISDLYTRLIILGYFSLISLEACINIGVATALLPTKGLGLPFISYGKSSLIAHIGMLGILYALIKEA